MDIRGLAVFLAVVDSGSFAAAARSLVMGRSTVSERIASLERSVGAPLFTREAGAELTAHGATLLPWARRIIDDIEAATSAVERVGERHAPSLRVGLFAGGAAELNGPLFTALRRALPHTTIRFRDLPLDDNETRVANGALDVAILRSPIRHPRLRTVQLFLAPRVVVTALATHLGEAETLRVADLEGATFTGVSRHASVGYRRFFLLEDERGGEPPRSWYPVHTMPDAVFALLQGAIATPTSEGRRILHMPSQLRTIPLVDAPPSGPIAVCRIDDCRPATSVFMSLAGQVAATGRDLVPDVC